MTTDELSQWLVKSKSGDQLIYHTGFLPLDKQGNGPLVELSYKAFCAAQTGFFHLVQRRIEKPVTSDSGKVFRDGVFQYIIVCRYSL